MSSEIHGTVRDDRGQKPRDPSALVLDQADLETLRAAVRRLAVQLAGSGLTIGDIADGVATVERGQGPVGGRVAPDDAAVVNRWRAHGLSVAAIATLVAGRYTERELETHFASRGVKWDEHEAVRLHGTGLSVTAISRQMGAPRQTVVDGLRRLGIEGRLERTLIPAALREQVASLRSRGMDQGEISKSTGLSIAQVKSALRSGRRKVGRRT